MECTVKKLPKGLAELTVTVPVNEMEAFVLRAASEVSRRLSLPGFRPGKAPYQIVEQRVGAMRIYQEAAEKAVAATYPQAVVDQGLVTVGQPEITLEKIVPRNPLVYRASVALLPDVRLGEYRSIKTARKPVSVTATEVEATVAKLRDMFAAEAKTDKPAALGDKVEINFDTYVDRVAIDGGTSKNHPLILGQGNFIPGFEDALVGAVAGQVKELRLAFPKDYHRKDLAGQPVDFKVTVNTVFRRTPPPLDDSFAKLAGRFEKLEELRHHIEQNIHQEKSEREQQRWELAVIDVLLAQSTIGEVPSVLLESEVHKMLHELEHEVESRGMKFPDYLGSIKKSTEDLEHEFLPKAERRIKTALILRTIANAEQIEVADTEIQKEVQSQEQQHQATPEISERLHSAEYRDYLRSVMRSQKVFRWLEQQILPH
ncbi:MAG: trigger factor [Patescibacteria group bacterium]